MLMKGKRWREGRERDTYTFLRPRAGAGTTDGELSRALLVGKIDLQRALFAAHPGQICWVKPGEDKLSRYEVS